MNDKFCKDCAHLKMPVGDVRDIYSFYSRRCFATAETKIDPVSGKNFTIGTESPDLMRISARDIKFSTGKIRHIPEGKCGPEGKLFEPKPPRRSLWHWIFGA